VAIVAETLIPNLLAHPLKNAVQNGILVLGTSSSTWLANNVGLLDYHMLPHTIYFIVTSIYPQEPKKSFNFSIGWKIRQKRGCYDNPLRFLWQPGVVTMVT
jgi:hypothetical protein